MINDANGIYEVNHILVISVLIVTIMNVIIEPWIELIASLCIHAWIHGFEPDSLEHNLIHVYSY